jgi:hypothetical protein
MRASTSDAQAFPAAIMKARGARGQLRAARVRARAQDYKKRERTFRRRVEKLSRAWKIF